MKHLCALAIAAVASQAPFSARACTVMMTAPNQRFSESHAVVLAVPKGISNIPKFGGSRKFRGTFRQTILWQVLLSWKGKYQPGDQFTTRQTIDKSGMCSDSVGQYAYNTQLLYLLDKEPFALFYVMTPEVGIDDFKFLQGRQAHQNGT